jgi:cellulose synthase/poly-beta-1,6-N-acetylglucosamine synthase-like glycosyltransferase
MMSYLLVSYTISLGLVIYAIYILVRGIATDSFTARLGLLRKLLLAVGTSYLTLLIYNIQAIITDTSLLLGMIDEKLIVTFSVKYVVASILLDVFSRHRVQKMIIELKGFK